MDTKSINTITAPAAGITIIRTHPQKNNTTVGITSTRTHPQKNITTVGITSTRTHPQKNNTTIGILNLRNNIKKRFTKGLEIIKNVLRADITKSKIPLTPTIKEQKEEMEIVSHKKTKPDNPAVIANPRGSIRQDPVKTFPLPGPKPELSDFCGD